MVHNSRDVVHLVDDFAGAVSIVDHLVGIGRTRIAHITVPRHSPAAQQRALGVTHALDEHGLRLAGRVRYGLWSQRWARQATRDVLAKVPYVDAIACGSDQIAAAAMEVVIASGRKVPDGVAITGYDNWPVCPGDRSFIDNTRHGARASGRCGSERPLCRDRWGAGRRRHSSPRRDPGDHGLDRPPPLLDAYARLAVVVSRRRLKANRLVPSSRTIMVL